MTHHLEMRFVCDACSQEETLAYQNVSTLLPLNWTRLSVDGNEHQHLCEKCSINFRKFMRQQP